MRLNKILFFVLLIILINCFKASAQSNLPAWLDPNYGGFGGAPLWSAYYKPSLKEVNNDTKSSLGLDGIKHLNMMGGTLRWTFYDYLQLGYIGGWFYGENSGIISDKCVKVCLNGGFHTLNAFYKIPKGKFNYAIGGGLGWYGVEYEKTIEPEWDKVKLNGSEQTRSACVSGDTIGFQVILEGAYKLARWIDIGSSVSYVYAKIDDLKQAGQVVGSAPKIDLSGIMIYMGPRINF
ncbi:MAG: hypothetical protein QMD92_07430 [bacterium]|nr:hypothetical protein [bacterium]